MGANIIKSKKYNLTYHKDFKTIEKLLNLMTIFEK